MTPLPAIDRRPTEVPAHRGSLHCRSQSGTGGLRRIAPAYGGGAPYAVCRRGNGTAVGSELERVQVTLYHVAGAIVPRARSACPARSTSTGSTKSSGSSSEPPKASRSYSSAGVADHVWTWRPRSLAIPFPRRLTRRHRRRSHQKKAPVLAAVSRRWAVTGSNRRPPACKAGALPAELTARAPSGIRTRATALKGP